MGKRLEILGADFSANALPTISYRDGEVITSLWPASGTKFLGSVGYSCVTFEVEPGEPYTVMCDNELSAPFGFSSTYPQIQTSYIGGSRYLVAEGTPLSGVVPSGANYMTFGQIAPDDGGVNLFPSAISIGDDVVDVSDYR